MRKKKVANAKETFCKWAIGMIGCLDAKVSHYLGVKAYSHISVIRENFNKASREGGNGN